MSFPTHPSKIDPELARIVERANPGARVLRITTLGPDDGAAGHQRTAKAVGYGIPVRIDAEIAGAVKSFVLHGSAANPFGHDRRADRAAELLLAADTFELIPKHVRPLDVGAFRRDGSSLSLRDTSEFYLLTEYAAGRPYADDLRRIAETSVATAQDQDRVVVLTDYLVALHATRVDDSGAYQRSLRDLLGSGQGIFGIVDAYPAAMAERLQRLEQLCLTFRWRRRHASPRPARIHGDFHPFNIVFDEGARLHVLDTSRGSLGDPADDVSCLAINYIFFALQDPTAWRRAFADLWYGLWSRYLEATNDRELLDVVAPFLCWRVLVLACPAWYPKLADSARERLLGFAEAALRAERFDPRLAEQVFR
jgi:hypothetical protein